MPHLDSTLQRLASLPVPEDLRLIDDAVIARVVAPGGGYTVGGGTIGAAAALALLLGVGSGSLTTAQPAQARTISPFAPDNPLAPSTLLDVHP